MTSAARQQPPVLVNPVLSYGYVRLKERQAHEEICESLLSMFEDWEFGRAKEALWEFIEKEKSDDKDIIGVLQRRNSSTTRSAAEAHCQDLLKAMKNLMDARGVPMLAVSVHDLMDLPAIMLQWIAQKRRSVAEKETSLVEQELQQSQAALKESVSSLHDMQKRMTEELELLRQRLDERGTEASPSLTQTCPTRCEKPAVVASSAPSPTDRRPTKVHPEYVANLEPQPWLDGRRRRKRKTVTGAATDEDSGSFSGAHEVGSVFIFHATKNSTEDAVRRWVQRQGVDVVNIRQMSHADAHLKSFKLTVLKTRVNELLIVQPSSGL
jgi:hypothetical protein